MRNSEFCVTPRGLLRASVSSDFMALYKSCIIIIIIIIIISYSQSKALVSTETAIWTACVSACSDLIDFNACRLKRDGHSRNLFGVYGIFFFTNSPSNTGADPGGVQGVRTPALLIRVPFLKRTVSINITGIHKSSQFWLKKIQKFSEGAQPPPHTSPPRRLRRSTSGALSDILDTRPCKILDLPLEYHPALTRAHP